MAKALLSELICKKDRGGMDSDLVWLFIIIVAGDIGLLIPILQHLGVLP